MMTTIENCLFCKLRDECPVMKNINSIECLTFQKPLIPDTYGFNDVGKWLLLSKEEAARRLNILIEE